MSEMQHAVVYVPNRGVWQHLDHFGDEIGLHYSKAEAEDAAQRFARDRANAAGTEVVLTVENQDGSVDEKYTYSPT